MILPLTILYIIPLKNAEVGVTLPGDYFRSVKVQMFIERSHQAISRNIPIYQIVGRSTYVGIIGNITNVIYILYVLEVVTHLYSNLLYKIGHYFLFYIVT